MQGTLKRVVFYFVLVHMRLTAAETAGEYIARCQSLARAAAVDIKNEACAIVEGVCDAPAGYQAQLPPPPPANPKSLEKKAMMETCRVLMKTDCSFEAFNAVFLDYYSDCFSLTVYGPDAMAPGCEDHLVVLDRFQREIDERCSKLDPPEWTPQIAV